MAECMECGKPRIRSRHGRLLCGPCYTKFEEKRANTYYRKTYGIELAEYERMFAEQKGLCASCGLPESKKEKNSRKARTRLFVDHCHDTGKVRGLLCSTCNSALGLLKEDPARIAGLLAYSQHHQDEAEKPGPYPKQSTFQQPPVQGKRAFEGVYYRLYCDDLYDARVVTIRGKDESRYDPIGFISETRYSSKEEATEMLRRITVLVNHPIMLNIVEKYKAVAWLIESGHRGRKPDLFYARAHR